MSRLRRWERLVLNGDFSAMPVPFRWEDSGRFAHFINVASVPGGFDRICKIATRISDTARETEKWEGNAHDLWLTLFYQHRLQRHISLDYSRYDPALDLLCETLRVGLNDLSQIQSQALVTQLKIGA